MANPVSLWKQASPTMVTIEGQPIRMMLTLRAAAILEDALETDYVGMVREMLQLPAEQGGQTPPPMPLIRQAIVVQTLMEEAGDKVTMEELMALPMAIFVQLVQTAMAEVLYKTPTGKPGVKKNNQGKPHGGNG